MTRSDADWVRRSIAGDTKAFGRLVEKYRAVACAIAYSVIGDFGLAEDVAQTAFLAAFNTLSRLKQPEQFPSWLNGIVSHLAVDQVRRMRRQPASLSDLDPAVAAPPEPAESVSVPVQEYGTLLQILQGLEEPARRAITLKYFADLSYGRIGEVMGVPASTVRGYIARGMAALRKALNSKPYGQEEGL